MGDQKWIEVMQTTAFEELTEKLVGFSTTRHINAFTHFDWPDAIEEDQFWFSPDALSVSHTDLATELTPEQLLRLAKWECINSFSLNTNGERELIHSVTQVMDELPLGETKEYLYHLINEENQHMWYFQKFCMKYAGKVYPNKNLPMGVAQISRPLEHFMVFSRILLFEEIGHYFNIINSKDERVHPFIREINQAHYSDESRHITFGRKVLAQLAREGLQTQEDLDYASQELKKTLIVNYNALYNPSMYRDAGLDRPMMIRSKLIDDPARQNLYKNVILKSTNKAFARLGVELVYPGDMD